MASKLKCWSDIPTDLKDMMLCHGCDLQAFEKDETGCSVVLPCAHVMCLECVQKRLGMTPTRDKVECPKCAGLWDMPSGGILGFPKDVFSLVLNNKLFGKGMGIARPNPKCALHPKEDVSRYCKECSLSACSMCCERHHKEHVVVPIGSERERLERQLTGLDNNLNRKISQISDIIDHLKEDEARMTSDIKWTCDKIQEEARKCIEQLTLTEGNMKGRFDKTLKLLEEQKESLESEQVFVDTLSNLGNESDKLSRVPGMKNMIAKGKQFSGKKLDIETLQWKFDVTKTESDLRSLFGQINTETQFESLEEANQLCFPSVYQVDSVPISCETNWNARPLSLFNQQHVIHGCVDENADKICMHNIIKSTEKLINVPKMKMYADMVVVDAAAGVVVASDDIEPTPAQTHLSGALHWMTLNERYDIVEHEVTPLLCLQMNFMNVSKGSHVLILTTCTTDEHLTKLFVYASSSRSLLHTITLPKSHLCPMSVVSCDSDRFVVNYGKRVVWIDHRGKLLQQYGKTPEEMLSNSRHIIQTSKGTLLIADWGNHNKVHLVSSEGKMLQYLLNDPDVRYPYTFHLDEQTGLLCVLERDTLNNVMEMKTFQFLPCTETIKQLCKFVQK